MLCSYKDIKDKIDEEPKWYDEKVFLDIVNLIQIGLMISMQGKLFYFGLNVKVAVKNLRLQYHKVL